MESKQLFNFFFKMNKKYKPFMKTKLEQNVELFKNADGIQGNQINTQNNIFGDEIEELNEQLDEE